jgi:hypothetical protein
MKPLAQDLRQEAELERLAKSSSELARRCTGPERARIG